MSNANFHPKQDPHFTTEPRHPSNNKAVPFALSDNVADLPEDIQDHLLQDLDVLPTYTSSQPSTIRPTTFPSSLPSTSNERGPSFSLHSLTPPQSHGYNPLGASGRAGPQSPLERRHSLSCAPDHVESEHQIHSLSPPWERTQASLSTGSVEFGPSTSSHHSLDPGGEQHLDPNPFFRRHLNFQEPPIRRFEPDSPELYRQNGSRQTAMPHHHQHVGRLAPLHEIEPHRIDQVEASQAIPFWPGIANTPTRFLRVSNVARKMSIWAARDLFKKFGDLKGIYATFLSTNGIMYLEFFDIRSAMTAIRQLHGKTVMQYTIQIEFCSRQEMSKKVSPDMLENANDGTILVSISSPPMTVHELLRQMNGYGDIMSYQNQLGHEATTIVVEYYDTRNAALAIKSLQEMHRQGEFRCQATYVTSSQPCDHQETYSEWTTPHSASSPVNPISPVIRHIRPLGGETSPEPSMPSSILLSRDGADVVATTTRFMESLEMSSLFSDVEAQTVSSPTSDAPPVLQKKHGQAKPSTPASSRTSKAGTVDSKGTHRNKATSPSKIPSTVPSEPTTSTSTTPSGSPNAKVQISRRTRSLSSESSTGVCMEAGSSSTFGRAVMIATSATHSTPISDANEQGNQLSGSDSSENDLAALIEDYRGPQDIRTTFMIRNIPNKYTQQMLFDWINETHRGLFDFLYLRMDFKNKCNVGYAFINFVNVEVVESFAKAHVGKKWPRFNSDKKCSLAYATIQGRDALIEKFRNSSVMEEDPSYRPKVFYTSGPNTGQERPFPKATIGLEHSPRAHGPVRRRHSSKG